MQPSRLPVNLPLFLLGVFWAVWLIAPERLHHGFRAVIWELQAPVWVGLDQIQRTCADIRQGAASRQALLAANRDLARLNAAYALKIQENQALREEVHALEHVLTMAPLADFRLEPVRVIHRNWGLSAQYLVVLRSPRSLLRIGDGVVFEGGAVGRIHALGLYTATVELVSSPEFRIMAQIEGQPVPVVYQGQVGRPGRSPRGLARQIPLELKSLEGLQLVTSSLLGAFPGGLRIGRLGATSPSSQGLFQEAEVCLDSRLGYLKHVSVLIPVARGSGSSAEEEALPEEG